MGSYSATGYSLATGAVAGTFKTLLGLKAANTTGHRGRLKSITVGGAGGSPQDVQVALRLVRGDNTTDGTKTDITSTKQDSDSLAANLSAHKTYTDEPTVLETAYLWEGSVNGRGTCIKEWEPGKGPIINKNQSLYLQAAPGSASAVTLSATMEWEE